MIDDELLLAAREQLAAPAAASPAGAAASGDGSGGKPAGGDKAADAAAAGAASLAEYEAVFAWVRSGGLAAAAAGGMGMGMQRQLSLSPRSGGQLSVSIPGRGFAPDDYPQQLRAYGYPPYGYGYGYGVYPGSEDGGTSTLHAAQSGHGSSAGVTPTRTPTLSPTSSFRSLEDALSEPGARAAPQP